ncbi:Queuine tRNA-ribosyltransferase [Anaerohalosphaera lusitana]|uniref:Queuine tRNA-ribosyltransferase n=1 Tax=Anaerohalosphaera lusitana TaxID=1936003 RepID=A0A1U9NMB3_9BACT|nr:tRNA guanosine(34) transglycosylase Tgt [Anaerohalosphaera lusitana]AQT68868.1 Queuine tRNA-ribosyltransferase [Anaerohalosphaera lusitana]
MSVFEVLTNDNGSSARRGRLQTAHGTIETPVFMPVGTRGSVKGLTPLQLKDTGSSIVLANTYHMMIRPGAEIVDALGDLHGLMGWDGPILTDSGGYQVFSLSTLNRVGDDGVEFASHIDGRKIYMDAEIATTVQNQLGADIIMCFDECTPFPAKREQIQVAVDRTIRWAEICKKTHSRDDQLLFGIVQGGVDPEMRSLCAEELIKLDFPGYAIGGLSVGEGHENMIRTTQHTAALLPSDKPRYLMGVGMPVDIVAAVHAGVDMFDCVLPTRNGRNAFAFTKNGPIRMRNSMHAQDTGPIDPDCPCYCCRNFGRGTLRHFFNVGEMLGPILVTIHNIVFYQRLMAEIRERIEAGTFSYWALESIELTNALESESISEYKIA